MFIYPASAAKHNKQMRKERCISHDRFCLTVQRSDRLTVCHTLVSCQNGSSYHHAVFTGG